MVTTVGSVLISLPHVVGWDSGPQFLQCAFAPRYIPGGDCNVCGVGEFRPRPRSGFETVDKIFDMLFRNRHNENITT